MTVNSFFDLVRVYDIDLEFYVYLDSCHDPIQVFPAIEEDDEFFFCDNFYTDGVEYIDDAGKTKIANATVKIEHNEFLEKEIYQVEISPDLVQIFVDIE